MANLDQAQAAAQIGDWAQLTACLQQQLLAGPVASLSLDERDCLLALALLVLEAGDFQERWDIAKVFPAFGTIAIAPLIDYLEDDDAELEVRWFAARILAMFPQPEVIPALLTLLQTASSNDLRSIAAEALGQLGPPAIAVLADLLADDQSRHLAVQALAQIRHSETIEPLLQTINDPQPAIRAVAIEALSSFHDDRVPPVLVQALQDRSASVRRAAAAGLGMRPDLAVDFGLIPRLTDRLYDLNLEVCQQAAVSLGRLGTADAVGALLPIAQSPLTPLPLRLEAVRALGWMDTPIALTALQTVLETLDDSEPACQVYQAAVAVLGRWPNAALKPKASQMLVEALQSEHGAIAQPATRQAIALGLGYLGQPSAVSALLSLLADTDQRVRLHVIAALKTLEPDTAQQRVAQLAIDLTAPMALRQSAAIALQEW